MADVSYKGKGAVVASDGAIPWPTGAQVGQLAVLVIASYTRWAKATPPAGWKFMVVDYRFNFVSWWKVITAADLAGRVSVDALQRTYVFDGYAQIFTFGDAVRVGNVTAGSYNGATALPGGMAVFLGENLTSPGSTIAKQGSYNTQLAYTASPAGGFTTNAGNVQLAFDLEPRPGPDTPTLLTPDAAGEVSTADDVRFAWVHNDPPNRQERAQLRLRKVGDVDWSYATPAGAVITAETTLVTVQQTITLQTGAVDDNVAYEWAVRTYSLGQWSPWSASRTFTQVSPPIVAVTAPTGTLTNDLSPTVQWTTNPTGSRQQTTWRVMVSGNDGVIYDSGAVLGPDQQFTIPYLDIAFVNGATYTFWVEVAQTGGATGRASSTAKITWTVPPPPAVTVAATSTGVVLTVRNTVDTLVDVERSVSGAAWEPVATDVRQRLATIYVTDVLAPFDVSTRYRVRTAILLEGAKLPTAWVPTPPVWSTDASPYLVDSTDHSHFVQLIMTGDTDRQVVRTGSVSYALSGLPSVDYGPTQGQAGKLQLFANDEVEAAELERFLLLGRPVWLRWRPDDGRDVAPTLIAITPDPLSFQRGYQNVTSSRYYDAAWVEVEES